MDDYYTFLNFTYFNESLYGLPGFDGFTPRSIYPTAFVAFEEKNATNVLLVIDTEREQSIGLAPLFNPYILGINEIMLQQSSMDYLGVSINDTVTMNIDMTYNSNVSVNTSSPTPLHKSLAFVNEAVYKKPMPAEMNALLSASG